MPMEHGDMQMPMQNKMPGMDHGQMQMKQVPADRAKMRHKSASGR